MTKNEKIMVQDLFQAQSQAFEKALKEIMKANGSQPLFRTSNDPNYIPSKGENFILQSMTEANDCLSLRQLLINHSRGISSNVRRQNVFFSEDQVVERDLDIVELKERREDLQEYQKQLKEQIQEELDEKYKKELDERVRQALAERDQQDNSTEQSSVDDSTT